MSKALVVIHIQNDITKHYKGIIEGINKVIDWAKENGTHIVYIKHNNTTAGTRTFKPETKGAELVPELNVVSMPPARKNTQPIQNGPGIFYWVSKALA